MERIAIFPGSFDPFTRGHEAIVDEALRLFDRVIVAIGHNTQKRGLLTVEARKRLIEELYRTEERVEVVVYNTLTGDEARRLGAKTIVRSVRNATDFEYERTMERANRHIFPDLDTVILIAPAEVEHISSSLVRELHAFGHDVAELMPEGIRLEEYLDK
ncbi:MAG: pantetheine-phosphate adenylyltransferase [Alistipes sp.]|nr:pantetheine-phosphate adenylyltransferase [Alistipes sp.]